MFNQVFVVYFDDELMETFSEEMDAKTYVEEEADISLDDIEIVKYARVL